MASVEGVFGRTVGKGTDVDDRDEGCGMCGKGIITWLGTWEETSRAALFKRMCRWRAE